MFRYQQDTEKKFFHVILYDFFALDEKNIPPDKCLPLEFARYKERFSARGSS